MTCTEDGCERPTIARSLCTKHYQRWQRAHPELLIPSDRGKPAIVRLLSRCEEVDGCWIYRGATCNGYARLRGEHAAKVFGHRLSWEFFHGPIPDGLTFDHLCENRACVNPDHGDLVPLLVNVRRATRGMAPVNRAKECCPQGHPYTGDNLVASSRWRVCRECRNETNRRYRARKATA